MDRPELVLVREALLSMVSPSLASSILLEAGARIGTSTFRSNSETKAWLEGPLYVEMIRYLRPSEADSLLRDLTTRLERRIALQGNTEHTLPAADVGASDMDGAATNRFNRLPDDSDPPTGKRPGLSKLNRLILWGAEAPFKEALTQNRVGYHQLVSPPDLGSLRNALLEELYDLDRRDVLVLFESPLASATSLVDAVPSRYRGTIVTAGPAGSPWQREVASVLGERGMSRVPVDLEEGETAPIVELLRGLFSHD